MVKKSEQEYRQIDEKIRLYKTKNVLTTVWILLYIAIVILEILALFQVINFIWGLLVFIVATIIKYYLASISKKNK